MKNNDAIGNAIGKHPVEKQAVVGWCTGSEMILWEDFIKIISRPQSIATIRPLAPTDPWQSLSLGEIKKWWPTLYR